MTYDMTNAFLVLLLCSHCLEEHFKLLQLKSVFFGDKKGTNVNTCKYILIDRHVSDAHRVEVMASGDSER